MPLIDTTRSISSAKKAASNPTTKVTPAPVQLSKGHDLKKPEVPMTHLRRGGQEIYSDYNTIDEMESVATNIAKIEMWIAKAVGTKLVSVYPGRQWGVQVNAEGGMMIISCGSLSTEKGYHIHMNGQNVNDLQAKAVRAAGEILERYGVSRNRLVNEDEIESLDRDALDRVISADAETTETL